jgi:uncharacterized protein (UPF0548 family)
LQRKAPSTDDLAKLVSGERESQLTYSEVGSTASPDSRPAGYRHDRWTADLGSFTPDRFAQAAAALAQWQVQRGAGLTIYPGDPVRPGATFALVFRLAVVDVVATGRIVYVTTEPDRFGFGYGTLPSHPERGEEAFHVVRQGSRLLLEIVAFSRPRHPIARLGAPVTRTVQMRVTRRYLTALVTPGDGNLDPGDQA